MKNGIGYTNTVHGWAVMTLSEKIVGLRADGTFPIFGTPEEAASAAKEAARRSQVKFVGEIE